uniref:Uncharacterized protein n=1 Tax=Cucumis melo TaxID=3656 RepID=A0A9I9EKS7_CUCME
MEGGASEDDKEEVGGGNMAGRGRRRRVVHEAHSVECVEERTKRSPSDVTDCFPAIVPLLLSLFSPTFIQTT